MEDRFSKEVREIAQITAIFHAGVNLEYQRTNVGDTFTVGKALALALDVCKEAEKELAEDFDGHA